MSLLAQIYTTIGKNLPKKKPIDMLVKVITAPDNLYPEKLMIFFQGLSYPVIRRQKFLKLFNLLKSGMMMCY